MNSNINSKEILKGSIIIVLYFLIPNLLSIPFLFFNIDNKELLNNIMLISVYFLTSLFFIYIYRKDIKANLKDFKKNYKELLKLALNYWLKGLFIMITCSFIFSIIGLGNSTNETQNIELIKQYPIAQITCAVLFGPIIEELVFRRSLKNVTNNIHLYSIFTGLLFGFMHVASSLSSPIMIIYLIPYSALGIAFGYVYKKTDNIFTCLSMHILHNTITIIQILILGGL